MIKVLSYDGSLALRDVGRVIVFRVRDESTGATSEGRVNHTSDAEAIAISRAVSAMAKAIENVQAVA